MEAAQPASGGGGAAAAAAQPADSYDDDSILQALRRLPPEELIKHMLETEEWADRLANQAREWPAPPPSCRTRLRPSLRALTDGAAAEAELARGEQLGLLGGDVDQAAAAVAARAVAQGDVPPGAAAIKVEAAEPAAAAAAPQLLLPAQGASGGAPLQSGVNPIQPPTYPYQ